METGAQDGVGVAFLSVELDQRSAKFSREGPGSQNFRLYGHRRDLAPQLCWLSPEPDIDGGLWQV